jgi:hypothetical protein
MVSAPVMDRYGLRRYLVYMKTKLTIEIEEQLYEKAAAKAESEGRSLSSVLEDAVRDFLEGKTERKPYKLEWKTERGSLMPGANPDDRESLYDLMDDIR